MIDLISLVSSAITISCFVKAVKLLEGDSSKVMEAPDYKELWSFGYSYLLKRYIYIPKVFL